MNKIKTISTMLLAQGLAISFTVSALAADKPNIIFILADDLGWADLSCYGSTFHESPNLDRLAAQGMRVTQAYSSSPYCSPSRASLLTGRHPARLKITDYIPSNGESGKLLPAEMKMELSLEEVTIAEVLRDEGYATWHVGKWHLGDLGYYPEDQGFQVNIAGNHSGGPPSFFWPYGDTVGVTVVRPKARDNKIGYHYTPVPGLREGGKPGEHLCDRLTSEAINLIEHRRKDEPFFLYLSFYDVHAPFMAKQKLVKKYQAKAATLGLPSGPNAPGYFVDNRAHGGKNFKMLEAQVNPVFAAMVETLDTNVGRLMAKLEELGIADNTIVLFTSDNGGDNVTSQRPLTGCKGWLYEGGVRVPWIVKWPGMTKPGSTSNVPIINTDIVPTVLETIGLPARPDLHKDGVSIVPLLRGSNEPLHEALFWHFPHYGNHGSGPCSSVRVDDWKLIHWIEDDSVELFNLATDLSEKNNVAAQHPEIVKNLRERLETWRKETAANMPRPKLGFTCIDVQADVPSPADLQCERAENPVIDVAVPTLSWKLTDKRSGAAQTAYRIIVASSPEQLSAEKGDLWDSGRIEGSQSVDVAYAGKPLTSRQQAFWRVKVWDQNGKESPWSEPASWRMALLDAKNWQARWIAAPAMPQPESEGLDVFLDAASMTAASKSLFRGRQPVLLFRRTFDVPQEGAADAIARVCGLGAFNLFINGQRIGDGWLDPISSDYRKVAYYKTFDITKYLSTGENVVVIEVTDGWYGQGVVWGGTFVFGSPKLLAEVEWEDFSGKAHAFGTEAGWKVSFGPTLRSNLYAGEMRDARLEQTGWMLPGFDDSAWAGAVETQPGSPRLVSQVAPSIKEIRRIQPVVRSMPKPGVYVFDFGEHFSGVVSMRIPDAKLGQTVTVQFGDFLSPDGRVNHSLMDACNVRQTLTYVCRGGNMEEWTPTFTYFGFRYAEVTGLDSEPPMDFLEGVFLGTEIEPVGEFQCSLELYNKMHQMALQTLQSNIHGIITDCPHREKCGWLGDVWMPMHTWLMNFDLTAFNRKFIEDIRLSYQPMGLPADIAGGKRQHPWTEQRAAMLDWMAATVIYPYLHYVYTADRAELERHYAFMTLFTDTAIPLIRKRYASGDLQLIRAQRFFFGDWGDVPADGKRQGDFPLFPAETPAMLSGTQTMIHTLQCLVASAEILGHPHDQNKYTAMADELIRLANENYFDTATASYGSQSANAWAYRLGMVPGDSREAFVKRFGQEISVVDQLIPTYGQMGLSTIFQSLTEAGHGPMVHALADARADRGFRRLIERGATTLWEFQGRGEPVPTESGNHPAFSGFDAWFFSNLCGIRPDPAFPGFKRTLLKPWFDPKVEWAKASHDSPYGEIRSEWKRQPDGTIEWNVTIPSNTSAVAEAPEGMQFEDGTTGRELTSGRHTLRLDSP